MPQKPPPRDRLRDNSRRGPGGADAPEASLGARMGGGGKLLIPSAFTILALCAGLSSAKFALDGRLDLAIAVTAAAALLDAVDGRIARMLGATTKIGAELDSLVDGVNFGVAPALTLYVALMRDDDFGWVLALIYCCAIILRLARFNTLLDDVDAPSFHKDYFVGVPAPAAALIAILPLAAHQQFGQGWWTSFWAVGAWMMFAALLAVSRIPTASLKSFRVPSGAILFVLIGVAVAAALLLTFPYLLMFILVASYLLHIPFAWRTRSWIAARPEVWEQKPAERRAQRRAYRRRRRPARYKSVARLGLRRPGRD